VTDVQYVYPSVLDICPSDLATMALKVHCKSFDCTSLC